VRSPLRYVVDLLAAAIVATWLAPIYWIALTAAKPESAINTAKPVFVSFEPTIANYALLFTRFEFDRVLLNSLTIVGVSTAITITVAVPAAYSLTRMRLRQGENLALFILSLRFMPAVVVVLPFYLMFRAFGLIDTTGGMILIYVAFGLPFAVWLLRGFLKDLPPDVEEAARIDRLGLLRILWRIVVPMARSGIAVTAIFTFVFGWNEYLYALVLTETNAITVPIQISKMIDAYSVLWGPLSAAVVLQLLPMIVVVFILQRHIVRGLTLGAIK
jgi:ABC-type glycerol-3-phosphate transport system permease component